MATKKDLFTLQNIFAGKTSYSGKVHSLEAAKMHSNRIALIEIAEISFEECP